MNLFGLAAALLVLFGGGFGIVLLLFHNVKRIDLLEAVALAWLFGCGLISLLLWSGGLALSGIALQLAVAAVALVLFIFGFRAMHRSGARFSFPRPHGSIEWILAALLASEILLMIHAGFSHGLGWDGLLNWEIKARYAFLNHGVVPPLYFRSENQAFTHPAYPLFIPMTELWLYLGMNEANQFWIKIIFPFFYASGATLLAVAAKRLTNRRWPGLTAAALMFFIPCLTNSPGDAAGGYADVPLAVAYFATIAYLLVFALRREPFAWRIFAASLALLPWIKQEGLLLWLIAATCGIVVFLRSEASRHALIWLLPGPIIFASWKIFLHFVHAVTMRDFAPLTWATFSANQSRLIPIAKSVLEEMLNTSSWSLLWPGFALALVGLAIKRSAPTLFLMTGSVAAPIASYAATYLFSNLNLTMHFQTSFSRLLLHVLPLAWLAIALVLPPQSAVSLPRNISRQSRSR